MSDRIGRTDVHGPAISNAPSPTGSPIQHLLGRGDTTVNPRMYRLIEAHSRIDHALREEQRRRQPDGLRLTRLKKLKLRVKDLMHRLARKHAHA